MLGNRRNRGRFGPAECVYGCCRPEKNSKNTRSLKRRENRSWKKEVSDGSGSGE